jgi:adenylate cyclase
MYSKDAHHKRSLFDKFKRKEKDRGLDELRDLPGSSASLHSAKLSRAGRSDAVPTPQKKRSFAADSLPLPRVTASNAKDTKGRLPFKTKTRENTLVSRNPNDFNPRLPESNALWSLDTDFSDLSDIIAVRPRDLGHPVPNDIYTGLESEEKNRQALEANLADAGAWDAPDSWDVAKAGEDNMVRMRELDDDGNQLEVNTGPPYCLRVFRVDSTFAVLSVPLNTTVTDIIGLIRRKSFLHEDDDKYMITMKKHDLARELEKNERPLVIQRKLLQQAGYTDSDKIEEVGRDDNSYLVRFTFLPLKKVGYASLADDPETEKLWGVTSFQHLDLSKKSLVTIPVTLHKRATEIISLNLSRNLSINVPKDFVQACTNLKELKFIGNEAWKIPPSFSYATRLLHLDVSNNRLEQLEHVELNKLAGLAVLRFANNKLTSLPAYFGQYKALRSLNISSNCLTSFPDSITEITSLTDLDISFNLISNIPDISKLTKLQKFLATNNKLTGSFPESTRNLISLKEIDIRHNAIDHIDVFSTLPSLEFLSCGYNHISTFQGYFQKIGSLEMNNNPITRFDFVQPVPSLWYLNLAKAKLAALPDDLFAKVVNLKKLVLDKNHFVSISPNVGKLVHLDHLSIAQNALSSLPPEIGRLSELRYLDLRENNLNTLPPQIWFARKLETLNLSSNVLGSFPKPGAPLPALPDDTPMPPDATVLEISESELGGLGDLQVRRPSQISNSNYSQSLGSASPGNQSRKGSVASTFQQNRKPSLMSRSSESTLATIAAMSRKDSSLSNRLLTTFAGTMKQLYLADNRLQDEVFEELVLLQELRVLNVSYNILYDLPPRTLRRWPHLAELYLSGNELRSLPAEDLEEITQLRALHINGNKFQVLPAELAKVPKLAVMDVGSNLLKYNVSNWPYDWNWNWNPQLKYLNMSGNMRLEIKPGSTQKTSRDRDLTDFSSLTKLRVLGLMDVTLRSVVPDQNEDRRVRTAGSQVGPMSYGMADTLGKNEHLSTMDLVVERFRSHEDEYMFGMFDGQALTQGGSRIARYLYDNFKDRFMQELDRLRQPETAEDALRRSYLGLNKEIAIAVMHSTEHGRGDARHPARSIPSVPDLMEWDMASGCVATVLFIKENELYVSNVGDATALLVDSDGGHKVITRKHDPTEPQERQRIKEAGGYVSRHGKLNDSLEVSRAFGYIKESPSVIAAPHTTQVSISENHELILIASRELWQYMSRDFAVDMARSERGDVSRAAQKLRDLAIAFGASSKIMVMVIGINDLQKRQRLQHRTPSMSVSPSGNIDELFPFSRRGRRDKNAPFDSRLARLDQEVEPPTGQVTLVFTDIKNSTLLWETYPNAMRSAIKMHNELMRRQLRIIGGYEVKTEGDAFIVSFPTVTSALLWCFTIQIQLLEVQWPPEILNSVHGEEVCDADGNVIFRGLSVRIGMHWGSPVCEVDPVTKRMDYFGPMVNRSARISSIADGGQITVSADFIAEIQRLLETSVDTDRSDSINSDEAALLAASEADNPFAVQIKRELRSLSSQGFEVKELGERRLKGLENPEYIYLMYPHALSSRLLVQQQRAEAAEQLLQNNQLAARNAHGAAHDAGHDPMAAVHDDKGVALNVDNVWDLCAVALRLEGLCNALESPVAQSLKAPETALLERIREGGGEITDRFLWNIVEHQVSRVEVSFSFAFCYTLFPVIFS